MVVDGVERAEPREHEGMPMERDWTQAHAACILHQRHGAELVIIEPNLSKFSHIA